MKRNKSTVQNLAYLRTKFPLLLWFLMAVKIFTLFIDASYYRLASPDFNLQFFSRSRPTSLSFCSSKFICNLANTMSILLLVFD